MTSSHGFTLLREQLVPELNSTARIYRHVKTGAELLSVLNDDDNKVFGVNFRTIPADSTGVAHILEHSVLCGSRKYPSKEPFVELMKGSLNTFLNAMTYSDKTCYPVASQNLQDFYNLIDVYLDAVFHPLITPYTLQQEGWHYELDTVDASPIYKGVVFNEMKGNYSSPDILLRELSQESLFPDSPYGLDAGGDPKRIPELTYAAFKAFHERYYHPSNARLFFYGDDDPEARLRLLDGCLSAFERSAAGDTVGLQPRFHAPKKLVRTFAASPSEGNGKKAMVAVNWMFDERGDVERDLAFDILEQILIGTPASPLRKALLDSGLGEDFTGGLDSELRQPTVSVGLKGIDPADADKVEALILETLNRLAADGIDPLTVEAAVNTVEFLLRENNTGRFPRGIAVMLRALKNWLHNGDPVAPLTFAAPLAAIKAQVASGARPFEALIARQLTGNPHRTTLVLRPDPEQAARETAEEQAKLAAVRAAATPADLAAMVENTKTLKRLQETPDPPEVLAKIPSLGLGDLPRTNKTIPIEMARVHDVRVFSHDLATNGIVYLDLGFDLHTLPPDLLPYVGVFARALLETGAGAHDFVGLTQRIGRTTGGIRPQTWISTVRETKTAAAWLFLRAKVMPERSGELLAILRDVLTAARLDNRERIAQIVLEEKAALETYLVPMGNHFAALRLRANFNEAGWAEDRIDGLGYLFFLRGLVGTMETDWSSVAAAFERIRKILVNRAAMVCNVTAGGTNLRGFLPDLAGFLGALPRSSVAAERWPVGDGPRYEGLTIPAQVNYVAKGADLHSLGFKPNGAALAIGTFLGTTWLWDKIRVQGGAYGGGCRFDRRAGTFTFTSYRDPNLAATLDVFDKTAEFLRTVHIGDSELTRNIIGTIGTIDTYLLPDAKGFTSLQRTLVGDGDDILQRMREEVLAANVADFRNFAEALTAVANRGRVVVLGSAEAIAAANAGRTDRLAVTKLL
ncbi:MAG: insulinase family protein [Hyphomicrobiaceae bacterium]